MSDKSVLCDESAESMAAVELVDRPRDLRPARVARAAALALRITDTHTRIAARKSMPLVMALADEDDDNPELQLELEPLPELPLMAADGDDEATGVLPRLEARPSIPPASFAVCPSVLDDAAERGAVALSARVRSCFEGLTVPALALLVCVSSYWSVQQWIAVLNPAGRERAARTTPPPTAATTLPRTRAWSTSTQAAVALNATSLESIAGKTVTTQAWQLVRGTKIAAGTKPAMVRANARPPTSDATLELVAHGPLTPAAERQAMSRIQPWFNACQARWPAAPNAASPKTRVDVLIDAIGRVRVPTTEGRESQAFEHCLASTSAKLGLRAMESAPGPPVHLRFESSDDYASSTHPKYRGF